MANRLLTRLAAQVTERGLIPPKIGPKIHLDIRLGEQPFPAGFLFGLWLLSMITLPILWWTWGDAILPWGASISVLLQGSTVAACLIARWGGAKVGLIGGVLLVGSWAAEWIGSSIGLPFGIYHYTDRLQPQVGAVPLLIPVAWFMMLPVAWAIAFRITGRSRGWYFVVISGLAFTAWDLYLDPQMVDWSFWEWAPQEMLFGGYFGIPWLNYAGWALCAMLLTLLCTTVVDLKPLPTGYLLAIYIAVWLLEAGGLSIIWGQPGPAFVGFVAMGIFVVLAVCKPSLPD
ncbi:MAG: carotenoid biosynthesis protein [Chloroflexota bacterium]